MTRRDFGTFLSVTLVAINLKPQEIDGVLKMNAFADRDHHIQTRRLGEFVAGGIKLAGSELEHLHVCSACQTSAYGLIQSTNDFRIQN